MRKQLVGIALTVTLVAGCGAASSAGSTTVATPTTSLSDATSPPDSSEGGFGSPAQKDGEFAATGSARPVRGELRLADNGCWYVALGDASYLVVFPAGFELLVSDPTTIAAPDGTSYGSGTLVDATAFELGFDLVPGGDAGRWGNYASFCDPDERSFAVFERVEPAFDPATLGTEEIEAIAAGATFTESWPCGRGWAASTEDQLVALFLYQRAETELAPGTAISLPDEAWTGELVVGKHLFVNHCDDVVEPWEPNPVVAGRWPLTGGTLELLDQPPEGAGSAMVRATLSEATVTTDTGTVLSIDSIDLENTAFNLFAG